MNIFVAQNGSTPLNLASNYNFVEIVQLLLEKNADVNIKDDVRNV